MNPVRRSVNEAVDSLDHVTIDETAIAETADELAEDEFAIESWDFPIFLDPDDEGVSEDDVLDFFFVGNAINFAFRDFETGDKYEATYDDVPWGGAFGMWASLKKAYDENPQILEGSYLADLSRDDAADLFAPAGDTDLPMLEQRVDILNSVGETLDEQYDGRFHRMIDEADDRLYADGDGIVDRLVDDFPSFDDSYELKGQEINFYKRAQLAPSMAYGKLEDSDTLRIEDMDEFTVFADYNLPNILRHFDILEYSDTLAEQIDEEEPLEEGSRQEVEIRTATVYAADRLMDELNERKDEPVYGPHLDAALFMRKDEPEKPVHKTRTTAY